MPKMFRLFSTPPPTNQPWVLKLSVCSARRGAGAGAQQGAARPVGPGVTAVDVGQNVRSDEIADASTGCPSCFHLCGADDANGRAAANTPASPMLPFRLPNVPSPKMPNTQTGRSASHSRHRPCRTSRRHPSGVGADDAGARGGVIHAAVGIPEAAAATAEDVEASPVRSHHDRRRSLGIGASPQDRLPRPIR